MSAFAANITIRRGPLIHLGMPGMKMMFRVAVRAMPDQVKTGDKVLFAVEKKNSVLTAEKMAVVK